MDSIFYSLLPQSFYKKWFMCPRDKHEWTEIINSISGSVNWVECRNCNKMASMEIENLFMQKRMKKYLELNPDKLDLFIKWGYKPTSEADGDK